MSADKDTLDEIVDYNNLSLGWFPKFVILLGDGTLTNEYISRDLCEDLLDKDDHILEINKNILWNKENHSDIRCVIIDNSCIPSDRLKLVSKFIKSPWSIKYVIINLNMVDSHLFHITELFPHWSFIIYSDLSDKDYFSYIKNIGKRIKEMNEGETDQWFPTYSLHSSRWSRLRERGKRLLKDTDRKLCLKPSSNKSSIN